MELENEKKTEEQSAELQNATSREGQSQTGGYQGYKVGRSPRPRIHQQTRPYNQGGYNRNQSQDEGGFRPEGFGAGLQSSAPQRSQGEYGQPHSGYRPRFNPNNSEGGYRPRNN